MAENYRKEPEKSGRSTACDGRFPARLELAGTALIDLEPVAFLLRNCCAKFAQISRLRPRPVAVLREDV